MNTTKSHLSTKQIVQILHWAWLVAMSVFVGLQYYALTDMVDHNRDESSQRYFQMLNTRVSELTDLAEALQSRPEPVTAAVLQSVIDKIEARLSHLEQNSIRVASLDELQAQSQSLRTELEQLKSRQAAPAPSPIAKTAPAAASAVRPSLPFRILGSEMRAGQRSLSVAPSAGELSADQIQIVLPGETVGHWQLHAIEGDTAIFHAGKQVRRLKIP